MERPTLDSSMPGLTCGDEISATTGDPLAPGAGKRVFSGRSGRKFRLLI